MPAGSVLPSELVSGPDLGGGFLHQLSIDRTDDVTTFTHHAQDGGQDAGGPPRGPLDVLGFVHPETACMFGGPRCWHRRYLLPFSELPKVRFAYQRHRLVLSAMLGQAYDDVVAPVASIVGELVHRIARPFEDEKIPWFLGGSAAGMLLGGSFQPHDIDLGTDRRGVDRAAELLGEFLVEPLAPTDWGPGRLVRGARAFVGAPQEGARVEWSIPLKIERRDVGAEFGNDPDAVECVLQEIDGYPVRLSRPEYGMVRAAERGRLVAQAAWVKLVRRTGPHPVLLDRLLAGSQLKSAARDALRASVLG